MKVIDQQLRRNDCGISAVKTICNLLEVPVSRDVIEDNIDINQEGTSLESMNNFLRQYEFSTKYNLLDLNSLNGNEQEINELLPCITPINRGRGKHYIVLKKYKDRKFHVLDPGKFKEYKLNIGEFRNKAHLSKTILNYVELEDILKVKIKEELDKYRIPLTPFINRKELIQLFNKLTYFTYLKENFGFKNTTAEVNFIHDLVNNQAFSSIPLQFQSLEENKDSIAVKAALLLSVQKTKSTHIEDNGNETNIYLKLFRSVKGIRDLWIIFMMTTFMAAAITYIAVFINQILIDHVLPTYQLNTLYLFGIGLAIFYFFDLAFYAYKKFISIYLGNALDKYFLSDFDQKLNSFSIRYLDTFRRGDLVERLSDSMKLKTFFLTFFSKIFVHVVIALFSISVLVIMSWKLSFVVLFVLFLFAIVFAVMTPMIQRLEKIRFEKKADFFSKFIEKIDGIQVVKSLQVQSYSSREIQDRISELINVRTKSKFIDLANSIVTTIIVSLSILAIILFTSRQMILFNSITLGMIITYIALSGKIFSAFQSLLNYNLSLQSYLVILNRFFDFNEFKTESKKKDKKTNRITNFDFENMSFEDIYFSYTDDLWVLQNLSLTINRGDRIFIQGKNGSGKSTLCKLLNRLYLPTKGEMNLNGVNIELYDEKKLMRQVVFISSEDLIFNDSLLFNISFGRDIDISQLIKYCKELDFYDFVNTQYDHFEFVLHENGKNLSTGQKRKVLLLRALMSEAHMIIMDEIFNGVDMFSKNNAIKLLNSIVDKTFVIISHMPVDDFLFNKKYNLENGRLFLQAH